MLTVLMIDDNEIITETVRDEAEKNIEEIRFIVETGETCFDKTDEHIKLHRPDILILDIFRDPSTNNDVGGQEVWESLWARRFCPVVVYTAGFDRLDPPIPEGHPFIRYLEKGDGTDVTVVEHIKEFAPMARALRSAEAEVERVFQSVLQDVALFVFEHMKDPKARTDMIVRAARRRVAATMDEAMSDKKHGLLGWEQYLVPPVGSGLLMGDVIQQTGSDEADPTSYRVILSPSCDIQRGECKVANVLLAKCSKGSDYVVHGVGVEKENKVKERVPIALNDAHAGGFVLMPSLPGRFPPLSVNMRDLDLVAPDQIGQADEKDKSYVRVVSVDSPFREQLAWAYLQMAGRPGLPDRDHSATVEELVKELKSQAKDDSK